MIIKTKLGLNSIFFRPPFICIGLLFLLISGCTITPVSPFTPEPGMTIEQVNKAAYLQCDGSVKVKKKHIVFIKDHPLNPEVKIYKTAADVKYDRASPECKKELYFYRDTLISDEELKELITFYQIELKNKQEAQRKIDSEQKEALRLKQFYEQERIRNIENERIQKQKLLEKERYENQLRIEKERQEYIRQLREQEIIRKKEASPYK